MASRLSEAEHIAELSKEHQRTLELEAQLELQNKLLEVTLNLFHIAYLSWRSSEAPVLGPSFRLIVARDGLPTKMELS